MKHLSCQRVCERGVTLVEMMVSLALFSLLIAGAVQAMDYINFSQSHVEAKTTRSSELEILKLNLDEELRNVVYFFPPSTTLPSTITNDSTLTTGFVLPQATNDPTAITTGNTLFFATSKLVPIEKFAPGALWKNAGRMSQTTIHCLYLRRSKADSHPGSFELVHYRNDKFVSAASASSFYLWTDGTPPVGTNTSSKAALDTVLSTKGISAWDPESGTVPTLPASGATRRVLYRYIGTDPQNAASALDGFDVSVLRNTIDVRVDSAIVARRQKYVFHKDFSILTRKMKL